MEPQQPQAPLPSGQSPPPPAATPFQQVQGSPSKTCGMAIASLVLGILGAVTCGITAIVGLILGIVSLGKIKRSLGQLTGQGLAIAGIIVSGLSILLIPILCLLVAIMIPALQRARQHAIATVDAVNMHQLCVAVEMYAADNNSCLPDPDNWNEQLEPYLSGHPDQVPKSPYKDVVGCGFAMNNQLINSSQGQRLPMQTSEIADPSRTVLFFEVQNNSPPAGGRELLPEIPRGPQGYLIGFVDGHVENVREDDLDNLYWSLDAF